MKTYNEENVEIFEDTLNMCAKIPALEAAIAGSIQNGFIQKKATGSILKRSFESTNIEVIPQKTTSAARTLKLKYPESKVCMLNFASATHPGGGVLGGASTQEESMCRCTTLYPVISDKKFYGEFYGKHKRGDGRYTSACIYTPGIVIIKNEDTHNCSKLFTTTSVDVVTCAAPNLRRTEMSNEELLEAYIERAKNIMELAVKGGDDILVLGAFGCGAFKNDPKIVASAWKDAIQSNFKDSFSQIIFAIPYNENWNEYKRKNYEIFKKVLSV